MIVHKTKHNEAEPELEHSDSLKKVYEKSTLTRLEALDIGTGNVNVPEADNGLLES